MEKIKKVFKKDFSGDLSRGLHFQNYRSFYTWSDYSKKIYGYLDPFAAIYSFNFLNLDFTFDAEINAIRNYT